MEVIKNYVDTMFVNLPQTEELLAIKEDILLNMVEKYQELLAEGKPENEAIGTVIAEFGSIEELLETFDIDMECVTKDRNLSLNTLTKQKIMNYLITRKYSGLMIAAGVITILIGISGFIPLANRDSLNMGFLLLFLGIISGIVLFIIAGMKLSKYDEMKKGFILKSTDRELLQQAKEDYYRSFMLSIVVGVIFSVGSLIPVVLMQSSGMPEDIAVSFLLIFVAIGCFFFIYAGNIQGSYTFLLENGFDEFASEKGISRKQYLKRFESLYWVIILTIFFVWGFMFGGWYICWIVFPIGGVLSNVIENKE